MSASSERDYEIVLFGATGFVGRLVAEYLAQHYGSELSWALSGRSEEKLRHLSEELSGRGRQERPVPYLVATSEPPP